jgi:hypothetical protein
VEVKQVRKRTEKTTAFADVHEWRSDPLRAGYHQRASARPARTDTLPSPVTSTGMVRCILSLHGSRKAARIGLIGLKLFRLDIWSRPSQRAAIVVRRSVAFPDGADRYFEDGKAPVLSRASVLLDCACPTSARMINPISSAVATAAVCPRVTSTDRFMRLY